MCKTLVRLCLHQHLNIRMARKYAQPMYLLERVGRTGALVQKPTHFLKDIFGWTPYMRKRRLMAVVVSVRGSALIATKFRTLLVFLSMWAIIALLQKEPNYFERTQFSSQVGGRPVKGTSVAISDAPGSLASDTCL